ncbi:XylR N-terminal domain-containing protein [Solibacillus sp. FSL H8-0538]|uniref:XylR N-terminal domain-containing protein n=1 Tax=Solibacillus sp. FSL H8-0538 TaxID=2921400 RepID=UPI0030F9F504
MKANRLVFENSFDVNPRTGIIRFNGNRMVLKSAEALGIFRRDIVKTLDMERAKGFLLRYGWACGYSAGESVKQSYNWNDIRELIMAGAAMHTLEGVVSVEIELLEVDDHKFEMEGRWYHSYEAAEHVRHFGFSEESICWTLVGYVAGFLAKIYPKELVVFEDKCRGKRDDYCSFIVRTKEHAAPEQLDILKYFKEDSLKHELDAAYKQLKELNHSIVHSETIQKQLTNAMLEGYTLNQLLNMLSEGLHSSLIIEKVNMHKPIATSFKTVEDEQYFIKNHSHIRKRLHKFPIMTMNKQLGNLTVIHDEALTREQKMMIESAISVFSVYLYIQAQIAQSQWQRKSDFLDEMLNGQVAIERMIKKARNIFNFDPNKSSRLIVIAVGFEETETILNYLTIEYPSIECFIKNDEILMILEEQTENSKHVKSFMKQLVTKLKNRFKQVTFHIGIGHNSNELSDIGHSYQDAKLVSRFLQNITPSETQGAIYEDFQHIILFLKTTNPKELIVFYEQVLEHLLKHDQQNSTAFIQTLEVFLNNGGNVNKAAKELNLSIPGFRYRMEKIESLLQEDLRNGEGRFRCQLAIKVYYAVRSLQ